MKSSKGFTLIEVMIAVVIIAILSAIAIPSYQDYIKRSKRSAAATALLSTAQKLESFYTANRTYTNSGTLVPSQVPESGGKYYSVAATTLTATQFTLSATPTAEMTGDKCGTFTITETGKKSVTGGTSPATDCWPK